MCIRCNIATGDRSDRSNQNVRANHVMLFRARVTRHTPISRSMSRDNSAAPPSFSPRASGGQSDSRRRTTRRHALLRARSFGPQRVPPNAMRNLGRTKRGEMRVLRATGRIQHARPEWLRVRMSERHVSPYGNMGPYGRSLHVSRLPPAVSSQSRPANSNPDVCDHSTILSRAWRRTVLCCAWVARRQWQPVAFFAVVTSLPHWP